MFWPFKRQRIVSFGLTEPDAQLIATLVRHIVTDVVRTELNSLTAAAIETLKPVVDTIAEVDKSCRLIIDGEALVEKAVANMTDALNRSRTDSQDEWWKDGNAGTDRPDSGRD